MKALKPVLAFVILSIDIFYLINPWKIIYTQITWLVDIIVLITILFSSFYLTFKIKNKTLKSFFFAITFIAVLPLFTIVFSGKPKQSIYLTLYTKANNKNETISVIHNHGFMYSKNTTIHQIENIEYNLIIKRKFEEKTLNGLWYIHPENPLHEITGLYNFKNGKVLNSIQNQ